MEKYKVEITKSYCIDLLLSEKATDEEQVIAEAEKILDLKMLCGTEHYYQTGDTEFTVYNITDTDDPFNPLN